MQVNHDGTRYAEGDVDVSEGYTISLVEPSNGRFFVDMWKPDGSHHWSVETTDFGKAVAEYNKYAKVKE